MKIVSIAEKYAIFVSGLCNYAPIGRIKVVLHCFTAVCFSVCLSVDMSVSFSQQWVRILKCNLVYRFILRISESSPTFGYDRAIIDRVDMTLDLKKVLSCTAQKKYSSLLFLPFLSRCQRTNLRLHELKFLILYLLNTTVSGRIKERSKPFASTEGRN